MTSITDLPIIPLINYHSTSGPPRNELNQFRGFATSYARGAVGLWGACRSIAPDSESHRITQFRVKIYPMPDFCGGAIVASPQISSCYNPNGQWGMAHFSEAFEDGAGTRYAEKFRTQASWEYMLKLPPDQRPFVDLQTFLHPEDRLGSTVLKQYASRCLAAGIMSYLTSQMGVYSFVCADRVDFQLQRLLDSGSSTYLPCYNAGKFSVHGDLSAARRVLNETERQNVLPPLDKDEGYYEARRFNVDYSTPWMNRKTSGEVQWATVGVENDYFDWENDVNNYDEDEYGEMAEEEHFYGPPIEKFHPEIVRALTMPSYPWYATREVWSNA